MNFNGEVFGFSATFFVAGISGLIFNWLTVPVCITLTIIGLLGVIFFGVPIWKAIFCRIRRKK